MYKNFLFIYLISSIISASEISISISEDLVKDYLKIIGNHEIPKGPKGDQAIWSIQDPHVNFEYGSADFLTTVTFKKGKTNIKKDVKKKIFVEYSFDNKILNVSALSNGIYFIQIEFNEMLFSQKFFKN